MRPSESPELLTVEQAKERIFSWISRKERSVQDVRDRLMRVGCDPDLAEQALARAVEIGVLSDERFCDCYARTAAKQGKGPYRIRQELKRKGIQDAALIERSLEQVFPSQDPQESLVIAAKQALGRRRFQALDKAIAFLVRRGFSFQIARQAAATRFEDSTGQFEARDECDND